MGVLNITPDSFSDGGQFYAGGSGPDLAQIVDRAHCFIEQGAAIIDIGGESTRPGAETVSIDVELARVIPVIEALAQADTIISVDTRHAAVAAAAIEAGAHMINDVTAGRDAGMLETVAGSDVGYVCMHMQGDPQTMQQAPSYQDVVAEVRRYLAERVAACQKAGIGLGRLAVDPGFGFGKTLSHNLALLKNLPRLQIGPCPLVVGLSRKTMLGTITGKGVRERLPASIAAAVIAVEKGAHIVRVHDVAATVDALKLAVAVRDA